MEAVDRPEPPVIRITAGNPTGRGGGRGHGGACAAASAGGAAAEETDDRPLAGGWKSYLRQMRRVVPPGREAWRYSGRP